MAGLADGSQLVSPEECDAVLSTQRSSGLSTMTPSQNPAQGDDEEDDTEEMTQRIWDSLLPVDEEEKRDREEKPENPPGGQNV
ncbi:hypothetical protein Hamer_G018451, partial [Homarus americanus]